MNCFTSLYSSSNIGTCGLGDTHATIHLPAAFPVGSIWICHLLRAFVLQLRYGFVIFTSDRSLLCCTCLYTLSPKRGTFLSIPAYHCYQSSQIFQRQSWQIHEIIQNIKFVTFTFGSMFKAKKKAEKGKKYFLLFHFPIRSFRHD